MKKIVILLLSVALIPAAFGQIKTGQIHYTMEYSQDEETDDEMSLTSLFEGSSMDLYFNASKTRTDMNFGIMSMNVIVDGESQTGLMMMSMFGSNYAVPVTMEQLMEGDGQAEEPAVELVAGSRKILKYKCKKAIQTDSNGNITVIWYTNKIKTPVNYYGMTQNVPGVPLAVESESEGIKIVFTATEILKGSPDETIFDMTIPEDFQEMSYDEFKLMGN